MFFLVRVLNVMNSVNLSQVFIMISGESTALQCCSPGIQKFFAEHASLNKDPFSLLLGQKSYIKIMPSFLHWNAVPFST